MRTENVSLPYPVLGISDDITPTLFETDCSNPLIELSEEGNCFRITVTLKLVNEDIINYIHDDYAEYAVEVSCQSTMFRRTATSSSSKFNFLLEKKLLNGRLTFECFVIAKKDINNYYNHGLNSDYEGHIINLQKGDLLVVYNKCYIPLNLDLRNIRNMRSFMTITKNKKPEVHSVVFDLTNSDGKILILLPEEMMIEYNKKPSQEANNKEYEERKVILKATLYLDALTYALLNYHKYKHNDCLWVNAIKYRLNLPDIQGKYDHLFNFDSDSLDLSLLNEIIELAQILLNQPHLSMLKQISHKGDFVNSLFGDDYGK